MGGMFRVYGFGVWGLGFKIQAFGCAAFKA